MDERRSVVASGKTVEDAIKNGLAMLGLRRDQVDVEVISEGSRGVLGFGAENARVRLWVKPLPASRPAEMPPAIPPAPLPAPKPKPAPAKRAPAAEAGPAPEAPLREPPTAEQPPTRAPAAEARKPGPEQVGREVLEQLLERMGIHASVEVRSGEELADEGQPPQPVLNLTGDDLGILIGRRGETLHALQYLARLMVSHRVKHWTNLIVDVENYRVRRRRTLESLARRVAEEVARSGRTQALEPMPPDERRVVHMTLRSHPQVTTQSMGEGEKRKVTIVPRR